VACSARWIWSTRGQAASGWSRGGTPAASVPRLSFAGPAAFQGAWSRRFHEDSLPPKQQEDWKKSFVASGVSEVEQNAIIAVFDLIDLDENGVIDKSEQAALELILADAGFAQKDIVRAIKEMDEDGNGEISREEFVQWWMSSNIHPRSKKIRDATKIFYRDDGRGDDKLD